MNTKPKGMVILKATPKVAKLRDLYMSDVLKHSVKNSDD